MKGLLLGLLSVAALSTACSTDVDDLFGGNDDGAGGAGGVSSTSTGNTNNTTPATGPSTSTATATNTATSTTGPGQTVTTDATTMQSSSMSTGIEPDPTVSCRGGGDCPVNGGGVCCWSDTLSNGECQPSDGACQQNFGDQTSIACQLPSQCLNQVCCAHRLFDSNQAPYEWTACADECPDPDRILCDGNNPSCPGAMNCVASTLLPAGYFVCSPN